MISRSGGNDRPPPNWLILCGLSVTIVCTFIPVAVHYLPLLPGQDIWTRPQSTFDGESANFTYSDKYLIQFNYLTYSHKYRVKDHHRDSMITVTCFWVNIELKWDEYFCLFSFRCQICREITESFIRLELAILHHLWTLPQKISLLKQPPLLLGGCKCILCQIWVIGCRLGKYIVPLSWFL